jgi:plastocyanin
VTFKGEAPEPEQIDMSGVKECAVQHPDGAFAERLVVNGNGTLKNVLVRVSAGLPAGESFPVPQTPARLDQKGCQYYPHVVAVMVGQQMVISNSDTFLHNVHALSNENPAFNFGQPTQDKAGRKVDPMKTPESFKVKCDVHPWMGAFVHVLDHPFFSVTGDDGTFTITGLPPGNYTLTAWHETLGEQQQADVKVEEGKPARVEFNFEAK